MPPKLLNLSEYARHRGVSRTAVHRAVQDGRISILMEEGKQLIDPVVADIQWANNTRSRAPAGDSQPPAPPQNLAAAVSAAYDGAASRAKRDFHEANLAAMREAKEAGALVDRAGVVQAGTDAGAAARAALERIPGLALQLAALSDPLAIERLLRIKVNESLSDLIDNLRRMVENPRPAPSPDTAASEGRG